MGILGPRSSSSGPTIPKPTEKKQKKSSGPLSFFEERRSWRKGEASRRLNQSQLTPGSRSKYYKRQEVNKMLEKRFPWGIDRGFVSRGRAISELRKMRIEESRARTRQEKERIKEERDFLAKGFGLKGKY